MAERGRPSKYGEELEKRHFNFPLSLSAELNKVARARGEDVTKVMHDALRQYLGHLDAPKAIEPTDAVREAMRDAVREAMAEKSGGVHVDMSDSDIKKLNAIAQKCGYKDAETFTEDFMKIVVLGRGVAEVQQIMFGGIHEEMKAKVTREEPTKPKQRKNAA